MNKLFLVGVPIGNAKDITLRALETFESCKIIACEDTRNTRKLFNALGIDTHGKQFISHHSHNEKRSVNGIIDLLKNENVVLVSDAGMPVVSDPGFLLVRDAINNNVEIVVIPGVSSVNTAFILSNQSNKYNFHGFLKPKTISRQNELKNLTSGTYVFFLSPHRIISELEDMAKVFGENTEIFIGRELTKKFETHYRGSIINVIEDVKKNLKGEFVCVVTI